jgi:hypothetical protein
VNQIAEAVREKHNGVAYCHWEWRGRPRGDEQYDWYAAECILADWGRQELQLPDDFGDIVWQQWARDNFGNRPYLAIKAGSDRARLVQKLQKLQAGPGVKTTTAMLAVLDGAPEYSRQCWRAAGKGGSAGRAQAGRAEAKDSRFYRFCFSTFSLHGGHVLGQVSPPPHSNGVQPPREFQDGCAVAFEGPLKALTAALHLRRALAAWNEEESRLWNELLHARVTVGPSWDAAVACLPLAWRDEIVVHPNSLSQLAAALARPAEVPPPRPGPAGSVAPSAAQALQLLFAAGVRVGPPG